MRQQSILACVCDWRLLLCLPCLCSDVTHTPMQNSANVRHAHSMPDLSHIQIQNGLLTASLDSSHVQIQKGLLTASLDLSHIQIQKGLLTASLICTCAMQGFVVGQDGGVVTIFEKDDKEMFRRARAFTIETDPVKIK